MTYIAKKVTANNHLPGEGDGRFPVYSKQFNELVDAFLEIEGTDGILTADTINEKTAGAGVTIDGVVLKDSGITTTGGILSNSSSTGIGYTTGAGGAVSQTTNRSTGVEIANICGVITTDTTSLAAGAAATFTVTNTSVGSRDVIILSIRSGATTNQTNVRVTAVADGSFDITVENNHASTAETGAIIINYAIIKSVAA